MKTTICAALGALLVATSFTGAGATETTLYERNYETLLEDLDHSDDADIDLSAIEATVYVGDDDPVTMPLLEAIGMQAQQMAFLGIDLSVLETDNAAGMGMFPVVAADGAAGDVASSDAFALFGTADTSASCASDFDEQAAAPSPLGGTLGGYSQSVTWGTISTTGSDLSFGNNGLAFSFNPTVPEIDDVVVYGDGVFSGAAPATVMGGTNYAAICVEFFIDFGIGQWDFVGVAGATLAGGYTDDPAGVSGLI